MNSAATRTSDPLLWSKSAWKRILLIDARSEGKDEGQHCKSALSKMIQNPVHHHPWVSLLKVLIPRLSAVITDLFLRLQDEGRQHL